MTWLFAAQQQSCDGVCAAAGLACATAVLASYSRTEACMTELTDEFAFSCSAYESSSWSGSPAVNVDNNKCFYAVDGVETSCSIADNARRMCPCS